MNPPSTQPLVETETTPNPKNLDKIVIKDISGLVNTLKETEASHEDASLSFAVKEQLEVVANIHSPELASYSIDNIIEFLRQNLDVCSPEKISANQNQAALMIQSIFFFNQARIKAMQEESTEVAMDILEHGASSPMSEETPFFLKAKPLWGKDLRDEMNVVCYFVCSFSKKEASSLILTGNNFFRVFLNGFFL